MNDGRVTVSQFRRGLDALQVSSLGRLYIAETDIHALITLYKDPNDLDRVCWRTFEDDINQGAFRLDTTTRISCSFDFNVRSSSKCSLLRN